MSGVDQSWVIKVCRGKTECDLMIPKSCRGERIPSSYSPPGLAAFPFREAGFPHRAALGVFLGQAREPLLRLLRAWTGENPLRLRTDNHLNHSRQP